MDKSKLLDRAAATGEDRLLLARILDKWEQADRRGTPACTDFLSPRERIAAEALLRMAGVPSDRWCISGGYAGAERTMLAFLPDWQEPEDAVFPLRCLRAEFHTDYDLTHRDILGSLMGEGIVRETTYGEHDMSLITVASEHADEYAKIVNDVKTYAKEWENKFITGVTPINEQTFAEYQAGLKGLGLEKAVAWRQEAYDAYISR